MTGVKEITTPRAKGPTQLALECLEAKPSAAWEVGQAVWPDGKCRIPSTGGGHYAAQMLLGRMRKQGHVQTQHSEGSSVWEITTTGRGFLRTLRGTP